MFRASRIPGLPALTHGAAAIAQTLSANVLIQLANLLAGIVVARHLGATGRGELAALITLPGFLGLIIAFGLPSALLYRVRKEPATASATAGAAILIGVIAGLVGTVAGILLAPWVLNRYSAELIVFSQAMMFTVALGVLSNILVAALQASEHFLAYNRVRYLQPVATLILLLVFGLGGGLTPYSSAIIYLLSGAPALIWSLIWFCREYRPGLAGFRTASRQLASYGFRAWGGELLAATTNQIDRVIVVGLLAPSALGIYAVVQNLARTLSIFPNAVASVLLPKTAGRIADDVLRITGDTSVAATLSMALMSIALVVAGPWLLGFLYGEDFAHSVLAFSIFVGEAALSGTAAVLSQGFLSLNRPGLVAWPQAAGVVLSVPLLYALAPVHGTLGAAIALLCGACARLLCTFACYRYGLRVSVPMVIPTPGRVRNLVTAQRAALRERRT